MPVRVWLDGTSRSLDEIVGDVLPLGAVIVVREEILQQDEWPERLARVAGASPWSPVVADDRTLAMVRSILPVGSRLLRSRARVLARGGGRAPAATAIAGMDAPTLEDFLSHLDARLGPVRGALIHALFSQWGGTDLFRRAFRRHGLPVPHDWYDLWLQLFAQTRLSPRGCSEATAARVRGVSVRELSAQSHRLFQMSWQESVALPWPARIERFLRIAGLCGPRHVSGVRRSRFNDVRLRLVGNRAGPGSYESVNRGR